MLNLFSFLHISPSLYSIHRFSAWPLELTQKQSIGHTNQSKCAKKEGKNTHGKGGWWYISSTSPPSLFLSLSLYLFLFLSNCPGRPTTTLAVCVVESKESIKLVVGARVLIVVFPFGFGFVLILTLVLLCVCVCVCVKIKHGEH